MSRFIDILGTTYEILFVDCNEEPRMKNKDGFVDKTQRKIYISKYNEESGFKNWKEYEAEIMRHEIIHTFMIESGLDNNWQHPNEFGHDETTIDWFAMQWHKINKIFLNLGI